MRARRSTTCSSSERHFSRGSDTWVYSPIRTARRSRALAALQKPVTLLFFTQTIDAPETAVLTRQVLDEVVGLNDLIHVEEVNFVLEQDRAGQYGIERIPAIALLSAGEDTRMRFLGAPAGYEFMSLVEAVVLAGTDDSRLTPGSRADRRARHRPSDIQVFVTPT